MVIVDDFHQNGLEPKLQAFHKLHLLHNIEQNDWVPIAHTLLFSPLNITRKKHVVTFGKNMPISIDSKTI